LNSGGKYNNLKGNKQTLIKKEHTMFTSKVIQVVLIVVFAFVFISNSFAQEWTKEQKEVWKVVESYTELAAKGDIEGVIKYFHDDFSGWVLGSHYPSNKATRVKFIKFSLPKVKTLVYDLTPLGIKIHGNVAIVHYSYLTITKLEEEKEQVSKGRWTDILLKEDGKWTVIGDHGGEVSK
jgi:ketosteroid isomerase-like protein